MNKKRKWIRWISLFVFIMAAAVGTKTMCYAKTYTIKTSSKPNKKTIKKLKKKKTYYIKARAYKLDGKTKVYGRWSLIRKVTIKK